MRYTAKKIATMLLTMVIVSFLTFVAFSLLSGDAATRLLGTEATPERLEALRIELGLNDPLLVRYGRWLWDALRGDLGTSYRYGQSVSSLIAQRLGPTLTLTALAFALIVAVSIPLGVLSAKYAGGWLDRALTVINQVVMAVPPFFTGILFTYLFGLVLHLFIAGAFPAGGVGHYIGYLFFPALAVALPRIAMTVKLLRTSILDEAQRDYVRTSMSRGRSRSGILYRHVLKNTLVPVLTFLAMTVADLLAGSVVIEQVFAVPGLGRLLLTSIEGRAGRARHRCAAGLRRHSLQSPCRSARAAHRPTARLRSGRCGMRKNTFLRVGLVLTALVVGFIVLGLFWTPYSPNAMDFSRLLPPSAAHPMGTDKFGRDILSRVMVGAGDTLLIALGTVAIGTVVGTLVGALTGWYGGWVDEVLMRLNDALASFPSILILLVLVSLLGGGREHMTLALGIVFIPSYARIVRSEFARARTQNYVHSAELMGASTARILFVHILPNIWHTLVSAITIGFNNAVLAEAAMSYLSIGVSPDEASLGYMLSESQSMLGSAPWYALGAGAVIVLLILGVSLIGEGLQRGEN